MYRNLLILFVLSFSNIFIYANDFSVEAYNKFLQANQDMSIERFYELYPPGIFQKQAKIPSKINFLDSAAIKYKLTDKEIELLKTHGFVVSERINFHDMWSCIEDIRYKDLPVFITSDMILHALHMSYDNILKQLEMKIIIQELDEALALIHEDLNEYNKLGAPAYLVQNLNDVDIFITVARNLLVPEQISSKFANYDQVKQLLVKIDNQTPTNHKLFSDTPKKIDFSQFKVRGHYTKTEELSRYFQAMIWLGRMQFYLTKPKSDDINQQTDEDIQRQIIDASLLTKSIYRSEANKKLDKIDKLIKALVGESDNVTFENIAELEKELGINDPAQYQDMNYVKKFQALLETKSYAGQKILSQILMSDPLTPDQIEPSSSFLLMGQRFVIDSYITGNVVYDKIIYKEKKVKRMLPSSLDVLFALGNNASADLLYPEFKQYPYMHNLAALRYLIDSYDYNFWTNSFYTGWLNTIRKLNAPDKAGLGKLPQFMKTAAWWQSRMNTQLASWAELRHDNLLYVKPSYSGGLGCFYPTAYLEPEPDLYKELHGLALRSIKLFEEMEADTFIINYFDNFADVSKNLYEIANAELSGTMNEKHVEYLTQAYDMANLGCVQAPNGWYAKLFFPNRDDADKPDYLVADIHTAPTDAAGNEVGWVWHVGTGHINMLFAITEDESGNPTLFAGPTMSFHEMISLNYQRHTDEEWSNYFIYDEDSLSGNITRPDFTNLYLADNGGKNNYENPPILPTSVDSEEPSVINTDLRSFAQPNPFKESVIISFKVPVGLTGDFFDISIYDQNGNFINRLYANELGTGNYSVKWDGKDQGGNLMPQGVYIYNIRSDKQNITGKVILQK